MKQEHAGIQSVFDKGFMDTSKIIKDCRDDVSGYAEENGRDFDFIDA